MTDLKKSIIIEIAQEIDCGSDCYFNTKTNEIIAIPNALNFPDYAVFEEAFENDIEHVTANASEYIKIEPLESAQSFNIMARFAATLPASHCKTELTSILESKKPFRKFKSKIDHSEYRSQWFNFKSAALEEIVARQLESYL